MKYGLKYKILFIPLFIMASAFAVWAGMCVGNLMFEMDAGIIESVDTNLFKSTINSSFPIIDSIYNSGNISVSVSGEVKNIIKGIFSFDLNTPYTILNVQSPLFLSYYDNVYKPRLTADASPQGSPGASQGSQGSGRALPGDKAGSGGSSQGSGGVPGNPGTPGSRGPTDNGNGSGSANNNTPNQDNNGQGQSGGSTSPGAPPSLPQLASSITFDPEPEEEEKKGDSEIVSHGKIVIQNYSKHKIDIAELLSEPLNINFNKKGPKVLIYHTHTMESYVLDPKDQGKKGIPSYNSDPRYNVVRVGEELARNLKKYGINVLHNGTVHDADRNAAYGVAIKTVERYVKSYPSIQVYLDIHRDGLDASLPKLDIDKRIKGKTAAQVMFVVGTDGQLPHPRWKENLKFALKLQQYLNDKYPGLARPIWISSKRYNQHVAPGALIIEIGGDGNLLGECLESTKYVAEALNSVMNKK